jgi:hypothetical protein
LIFLFYQWYSTGNFRLQYPFLNWGPIPADSSNDGWLSPIKSPHTHSPVSDESYNRFKALLNPRSIRWNRRCWVCLLRVSAFTRSPSRVEDDDDDVRPQQPFLFLLDRETLCWHGTWEPPLRILGKKIDEVISLSLFSYFLSSSPSITPFHIFTFLSIQLQSSHTTLTNLSLFHIISRN